MWRSLGSIGHFIGMNGLVKLKSALLTEEIVDIVDLCARASENFDWGTF